MRVEVRDGVGYMHVIDSTSPELVGRWFAEKAETLMSANTTFNHPLQMDIWPATAHEHAVIGQHSVRPITADSLLELARHLMDASEKLQELERTAAA